MSPETIRKKLKEIIQQKEQAVAQLNALCGAEQVLRELLAGEEDNPDE